MACLVLHVFLQGVDSLLCGEGSCGLSHIFRELVNLIRYNPPGVRAGEELMQRCTDEGRACVELLWGAHTFIADVFEYALVFDEAEATGVNQS